jgi:hypothetical protein
MITRLAAAFGNYAHKNNAPVQKYLLLSGRIQLYNSKRGGLTADLHNQKRSMPAANRKERRE